MNNRLLERCVLVVLLGGAFLLGRGVQPVAAGTEGGLELRGDLPQDPGGQGPGGQDPGSGTGTGDLLVYGEAVGAPMGNNGIIAVTGSYGVGTSVLYVVDTVKKQLAVYEARGGTNSMRRLVLVGARRIDLDLSLEGYNDESEYDYSALRRRFAGAEEKNPGQAPMGLPRGDRDR